LQPRARCAASCGDSPEALDSLAPGPSRRWSWAAPPRSTTAVSRVSPPCAPWCGGPSPPRCSPPRAMPRPASIACCAASRPTPAAGSRSRTGATSTAPSARRRSPAARTGRGRSRSWSPKQRPWRSTTPRSHSPACISAPTDKTGASLTPGASPGLIPTQALRVWVIPGLAARLPVFGLGADIIAGFAGETDADHAATRALVEALPFTYLHVFPFSVRPGAPAARLGGQVAPHVVAARARELRELGERKALAYREAQRGRRADGVVSGRAAGRGEVVTEDYLSVYLPGDRWDGRPRCEGTVD